MNKYELIELYESLLCEESELLHTNDGYCKECGGRYFGYYCVTCDRRMSWIQVENHYDYYCRNKNCKDNLIEKIKRGEIK